MCPGAQTRLFVIMVLNRMVGNWKYDPLELPLVKGPGDPILLSANCPSSNVGCPCLLNAKHLTMGSQIEILHI